MPSYLLPDVEHPAHLPGEPVHMPPPAPLLALRLIVRAALLALLAAIVAPLWLPFLIGVAIWGYPPTAVGPGQVFYYLGLLWYRRPPTPDPGLLHRLWLTLSFVRPLVTAPLSGLAWQLDLLIFGRRLRAVEIRAPIIKISAARSGSTQLARYIEADPRVVSPNAMQILVPYLWLWHIVTPTLGRLIGPERVRRFFERTLPPEFVERHEVDPLRTDTFEVGLYTRHLNRYAAFLGPEIMAQEFSLGVTGPTTEHLWKSVFVDLLDGIARKTLLFAGAGSEQRLFVKGHFLAAADAIAARYPDGRYLTVIRQPSKRVQSMTNFLWCNPTEAPLGKPPWRWLAEGIAQMARGYNLAEQAWFTAEQGPRRTVLRFTDYVADLEGTMRTVYGACFDAPTLPAHVPTTHAPRTRTDYCVDRSLEQLGISGAAYDASQSAYTAWALGIEPAGGGRAVAQSTAETGASG